MRLGLYALKYELFLFNGGLAVLRARHFASLAPLRDGRISGNNGKLASEKNSDCFTALDRVIFA